ncbi:MAG: transglutaminase domain-containing protein [Ruminococcus sp.]|nr:transglutaminase domain-containing protein [Ruminococcus sp.]MBQ7071243.1 transglutaminase domain-containing protein [Ruminococcus sp.]
MKKHKLKALALSAIMFLSCAACSDKSSSSQKEASSAAAASASADPDKVFSYTFDTTVKTVEAGGKKFETYINRPIRFDFKELPYEEWLAYEGPYDKYNPYNDSTEGVYGLTETVSYALRYAYENDIEYLDIPFEYDTALIDSAWTYATLLWPNIPDAITMSTGESDSDGYTTICLSDSVRKCAASTEPIEAAEKIIAEMPADLTTDAEKAYYLYDWVCQNVVYDQYHADNNIGMVNAEPQSLYGALVDKRAVCDGIAGALQLLFEMAGIDCGKICADSITDDSGHVWNYAIVDGEVWDFDATWDICRYYADESDEITEEEEPSAYSWFAVSRSAKGRQYSLTEESLMISPATQDAYSEKSAGMMTDDICVNISEEPQSYSGFEPIGSEVDDVIDRIRALKSGETLSIRFNYASGAFMCTLCQMDPIFEGTNNADIITFFDSDLEIIEVTAP